MQISGPLCFFLKKKNKPLILKTNVYVKRSNNVLLFNRTFDFSASMCFQYVKHD